MQHNDQKVDLKTLTSDFLAFVNTNLFKAKTVDCQEFKDVFEVLREVADVRSNLRIAVLESTATNLIKCVSEYCYQICTEENICKTDLLRAISILNDMFTFIVIPIEIWVENIVYMLSISVISASHADSTLQTAIGEVIHKDTKGAKAYLDMCKNVISGSKNIKYSKAFNLKEYAQLYCNHHDHTMASKHAYADYMAMCLLMEEEGEKNNKKIKNTKKTKKNKRKQKQNNTESNDTTDWNDMYNDNEFDIYEEIYWDELYSCFDK